jgi:hypothetical protein
MSIQLNASKINAGTLSASRIPEHFGAVTKKARVFKVEGGYNDTMEFQLLMDGYIVWGIGIAPQQNRQSGYNQGDLYFRSQGNNWNARMYQNNAKRTLNITGQHNLTPIDDSFKFKYGYIVCANQNKYLEPKLRYSSKIISKNISYKDALPIIDLSRKSYEKTVIGVICNELENFNLSPMEYGEENKEEVEYYSKSIIVNSIGEGAIWVIDSNGIIEAGDYITSSEIPGLGMKQNDDVLHNYTVAKSTMSCNFIPNLIYMKDFHEQLIYDENKNPKKIYEYLIEYIDSNGNNVEEKDYMENPSNYYRKCLIGCTYHCG